MPENLCLGCRLANKELEVNVIYENEWLTCLLDIAPLHEGHMLILPKNHYHDVDDLDARTASEIMKVSVIVVGMLKSHFRPDGITILQNNGKFNDLAHYHMHVFPRYESDGFAWVEPLDTTNARGRLQETAAILAERIKSQLQC